MLGKIDDTEPRNSKTGLRKTDDTKLEKSNDTELSELLKNNYTES